MGSVLAHAPGLVYIHEPFNPGYGRPFTRAPFTRQFQYVTPANAHVYEPGLRETLGFYYGLPDRLRAIRQSKGPAWKAARAAFHAIRTWAAFQVHRRSRRWRPLVKDPIALLSAEWLAERFDMQVVVMIRHPAGFVSSALRHPGILTRAEDFLDQPELMEGPLAPFRAELESSRDGWPALERAVLQWRLLNGVVAGFRRRHPEWTYLRHEDLCADPEAGFLALADRLGVDFAADARRVLERTSRPGDSPEVETAWEVRRNSRAVPTLFRTRLSAEQIATVRLRSADVSTLFYGDHDW